jgi:hypothetical protein
MPNRNCFNIVRAKQQLCGTLLCYVNPEYRDSLVVLALWFTFKLGGLIVNWRLKSLTWK